MCVENHIGETFYTIGFGQNVILTETVKSTVFI